MTTAGHLAVHSTNNQGSGRHTEYVILFRPTRPQTGGIRKGLEQDTEQGRILIHYQHGDCWKVKAGAEMGNQCV